MKTPCTRIFGILRIIPVFCAFFVLAHPAALQATNGQSLKHALLQAYMHNPALHSARMQLKAIEENLTQAYSNYRPHVASNLGITAAKNDGSNFGTNTNDGSTSKDVGVSFEQPVYRGGRTAAAVDGARHAIKAEAANLDEQEQDLLLETVTAYVDVLRDQHIAALRQQNVEAIRQELNAAHIRFDVGDSTKTDVALARARLARAEADLTTASGALETSYAVYEELTGERSAALLSPVIDTDFPDDLITAKERALSAHPKIIQAQENFANAQSDIDEIFGELLPEVNLSGLWNRTYDPQPGIIDEQTNRSIGIQATIPLYMGGGTRSRVRAARYTAQDYESRIETAQREVTQNLVSQWARWTATKDEIRARESQAQAAQIALEGMQLERNLGMRSTLDVLTADQDFIAAREAVLVAQRNEVVARFSVLAATGSLTHEYLGLQNVDEP